MDTPEVILSLQTNGATVKPFIYSEGDLHCHRCGTALCRYHSLFQNESPDVLKKPEATSVAVCFFGGESHDYEEKIEHFE